MAMGVICLHVARNGSSAISPLRFDFFFFAYLLPSVIVGNDPRDLKVSVNSHGL